MSQAISQRSATVVPLRKARATSSCMPIQVEGAEVIGGTPECPLVAFGTTQRLARRAISCLVRPEPGDQVLITRTSGELWVLAILSRNGGAPIRLAAEGDLEITAERGRLALTGGTGIDLATPNIARITAGTIALHARTARAVIDDVVHVGKQLATYVERVKLVGQAIESVIDRVMMRAKRSYRFIEEGDHLRCADLDHRASETLHLNAGNAFVTARGVVKLDGEQIHMG
jgi:hypothetical protein